MPQSPLAGALRELAKPWAEENGFRMISPYVLARRRADVDVEEVIEFQWSVKHPYRTYTVNVGLFHPEYCEQLPAEPKDLSAMHCGRETRLGHLMTRSAWKRSALWYRYGSPWHFWALIPPYGDFWWRYGRTVEEAIPAVRNTLHHLTAGGIEWFQSLRQVPTVSQLFDPKTWAWFESPGAWAKRFGPRRSDLLKS